MISETFRKGTNNKFTIASGTCGAFLVLVLPVCAFCNAVSDADSKYESMIDPDSYMGSGRHRCRGRMCRRARMLLQVGEAEGVNCSTACLAVKASGLPMASRCRHGVRQLIGSRETYFSPRIQSQTITYVPLENFRLHATQARYRTPPHSLLSSTQVRCALSPHFHLHFLRRQGHRPCQADRP